MDYLDFVANTFEEFKTIQEAFLSNYKIDDYHNWFYDQETGLLTFSTNDKEINFRYIPIGTYSVESGTWMWVWKNERSIEKNRQAILKIKEFGEKEQFERLKTGHFDSETNEGWEFVAISNKILNGIGGYRVLSGHLYIYMVIKERIDNERAKKIKEQIIECQTHGHRRMAFICQHLNKQIKAGFEEAFSAYKGMELDEDEDLQAWCDECEKMRISTDGWNEKSMKFADIKLVCEDCYFEIKEFNLKL